ncbi:MAG: four helix bundle protein [Elusimicrobiota bacterium]
MQDLKERTYKFALQIIKLVQKLPQNQIARIIAEQMLRSGTSVGANTEEAYAGLTKKDFSHSINISRKETLETRYWLRLLLGAELVKKEEVANLFKECDELIKIFTSTVKKVRSTLILILILTFNFNLSFIPLTCLYSYTSLESYYGIGGITRGLSAESVGLGSVSTTVSQDVAAVFTNPACMELGSDNHGVFSFSPAVVWTSDKRNHSYIATSYTTNRNIFFQPTSIGMLWSSIREFVFGLGAAQAIDFNYVFQEKSVRDRGYGNSNGQDTIDQHGNLFDYGLAVNYQLLTSLNLGVAGLLKNGDIKSEQELNTFGTSGAPDIIRKINEISKLSGNGFNIGVLCSVEDIMSLGLAYKYSAEIKREVKQIDTTGNILNSSSTYTIEYKYPNSISAGIKYNFRDKNNCAVFIDASFADWSTTNPLFRDVLAFSLGFEHLPLEGMTVRYGFSYLPSYIKNGGVNSALSIGCGFAIPTLLVEIDIAGSYAWQESTQERLFFSDQRDTVYDTTTRLITTVRYRW